jgi:putative ABC transport system permease protein
MNYREAVRSALRGLRANKLRAALTTLGIVIGVSAVIVLVALGHGMQAGFAKTFGALGNQIVVTKTEGSAAGGQAARDLTDSDLTALRNDRRAPDVVAVTPVVTGAALLRADSGKYRTSLVGSTSDYLGVRNRQVVAGRFFTDEEVRGGAKVVVLGPEPLTNLFQGDVARALGAEVRIGRPKFKVIGVLKGDGQQDDLAVMPMDALRGYLLTKSKVVDQFLVRAVSTDRVPAALDQVNQVLGAEHQIRDPEDRDFEATAYQNLLDEATQFLTYLALFTVAVAAISLVVGGIGVANIMLVSVTERTREIGIRKAVGARRSAILKQFLIEACVLTTAGGLIGILFGTGVTLGGAAYLTAEIPNFPPPVLSIASIGIAFGISGAIGVVAGVYPAFRAARMRPIDALRFA